MRKLKDALKRIAVIGATMALTLGMAAPATTALAADLAGEVDPSATLEQNQKTATKLDENLETKVTLSFPGKREAEPSDVVFVLDKSGASAQTDIFNQAKEFLGQISQKAKDDGLDIKVGVVLFNRVGNIQQPLTDVVTGYDDILNAMNSSLHSGTNMDAGLLAAKSILDADTAVKAENKHVILISDGATYLYCKNGDYTKPYTRSFGIQPSRRIQRPTLHTPMDRTKWVVSGSGSLASTISRTTGRSSPTAPTSFSRRP